MTFNTGNAKGTDHCITLSQSVIFRSMEGCTNLSVDCF